MKRLDVAQMLRTARERTGLSDFGPPDFMEGLTVLVEGLNEEGDFTNFDTLVEQRFIRHLVNRLWFAQDLKDHPEILDEDIGSPVIIAALPRTGSTKLHRIMGASGGVTANHFWNANMFARIPGEPDGGKARRIRETLASEKWMYETSPGILTGHPFFTHEPEECQWLMEASFRHPLLFAMFETKKYGAWLAQADMKPTFDYYLMQLKYQQWQACIPRTGPWIMKTPNHFGHEKFLAATFKTPRFLITHRDPVKCLPSIVNAAMVMRKLYTDRDTSRSLGQGMLEMFPYIIGEHLNWRDSRPDLKELDLSFKEVAEDGVSAVRKVYAFLDMPFTEQAERGVRDWERANPREKHGNPSYSAEALGLTDAQIRKAVMPYIERYGQYI